MFPRHSQIMKMDVTVVLFIEFLDLQFHYDPMFDSLYITSACHFHLYFFACRDFVVLCPSLPPTVCPDCTIYSYFPSDGPSSTPSCTTTSTIGTCLTTPSCSLPTLREWALGGCHLFLFVLCSRWRLRFSRPKHGKWVPIFRIHLDGDSTQLTVVYSVALFWCIYDFGP